MTRSLFSILILSAVLICETACGKSPLLHHENASDTASSGLSQNPTPADTCPLVFPKSGLCASLDWTPPLAARKKLSFTLKFWKKSDATANGPYSDPSKTPYVLLWMPSMGHGSSEVTLSRKTDRQHLPLTGIYESNDASFIMGGAWDVHVQLKDGDTVVEEAIAKVKI
jgi:hypothetical protein